MNLNINCELEPNHTHFVLFDDETDGVESIQLKRQEIERQLSRTLMQSKADNHHYYPKSGIYSHD
jgi:hypothetical protein